MLERRELTRWRESLGLKRGDGRRDLMLAAGF
jgi:hypothetical protein